MSDIVGSKAAALASSDRVTELKQARVFAIEGTNGLYTVIAHPAGSTCSCRAPGRCYHVDAISLMLRRERTAALGRERTAALGRERTAALTVVSA